MISFAPCKINMGLQVTAKRPDGYHELSSVFYPVPLHDIIEVTEREQHPVVKCTFSSSGIITDADEKNNLCVKAYHLLDGEVNLPPVNIHLHKQIPVGAGLGGGSSDAATVLKMLNKKFDLKITDEKLKELAAKLGSDCPFFIKDTPHYVSGRGEILSDTELNLEGYYIMLVKPAIFISTKEAYSLIKPKPAAFNLKTLEVKDIHKWKNEVINDFEDPLFEKYPMLSELKSFLYDNGAVYASMSGSGSVIYGIFKNEPGFSVPFKSCEIYIKRLLSHLTFSALKTK